MERKLVNHNGSSITIIVNPKTGDYLLKLISKDGSMFLMFIKDVEKEIEMLLGEGYVEIKKEN